MDGAMKWQPIETAPRDGTWIVACEAPQRMYDVALIVCRWCFETETRYAGWYDIAYDEVNADFWMPFTNPPARS